MARIGVTDDDNCNKIAITFVIRKYIVRGSHLLFGYCYVDKNITDVKS